MNNTRTWSILTAVIVVLIAAGGWFLLVSPKKTAAAALRRDSTSADGTSTTLRAQIAALQQQNADLPKQQRLLRAFVVKMPPTVGLPTLIRSISGAATAAGADLISLAPGVAAAPTAAPVVVAPVTAPTASATPTPSAPPAAGVKPVAPAGGTASYTIYPITIAVNGTYFVVEKFLTALESLPRALVVNTLTVGPGTGATGVSSAANLAVTLTATAYVAPPSAALAAIPSVTASPSSGR